MNIVEIPERLMRELPERCYTPLEPGGKKPVLNNWPERPLAVEELKPYLEHGHNYGIIAGAAGLNIVDLESCAPLKDLKARLLQTFTVLTGGGGLHLYYKGSIDRGLEITGPNGEHWGEIRAGPQQVVGPGSIHPSGNTYKVVEDRPIAELTEEQLKTAFGGMIKEKPKLDAAATKQLVENKNTVSTKMPIDKVCEAYGFASALRAENNGEYWGPHPVHGSDNGHNFWVNIDKQVWHCFRHETGGDSLMLIAVLEGIIDCSEAVPGALRGEKFNRAVKIALEKGLLPQEEYNKWAVDTATKAPMAGATNAEEAAILTGDFLYTDAGNTLRFAAMWGDIAKHTPEKGWLVWDGKRWVADKRLLFEKARETALSLLDGAKTAGSPEETKAILAHVKRTLSRDRLNAMVDLARGEKACRSFISEFDRNPWLLNVQNGVVALHTGELLPHKPEYKMTKMADVDYTPGLGCPKWLEFLDLIFQGDQELIDYVQKLAGYTLTGVVTDRLLVILYGTGRNGKTTFMKTTSQILGDYAGSLNFKALSEQKYSGVPNDIAKIAFCRLVTASEGGEGQQLNMGLIKELTGRQTGRARFLYGEWFDFEPIQKYWVDTNFKPYIRETDIGTWDRIRLIPFEYEIPEERVIKNYEEVLLEERAGIFNWLIEGCLLWQKEGLKIPEKVRAATREYRTEMDLIGQFLEECCVLGDYMTKRTALYGEYVQWFAENFGGTGEEGKAREKPMGCKTFYAKLRDRGLKETKYAGTWVFAGVKLVSAGKDIDTRQNPMPTGENPAPVEKNPTPLGQNPTPVGQNPDVTDFISNKKPLEKIHIRKFIGKKVRPMRGNAPTAVNGGPDFTPKSGPFFNQGRSKANLYKMRAVKEIPADTYWGWHLHRPGDLFEATEEQWEALLGFKLAEDTEVGE